MTPTLACGPPAEVTSFVGRRREAANVRRMLSDSRLVTLTGMGGVGKTRLAMRVGSMVRRGFPDGVWVLDLGRLDGSGTDVALDRNGRMLVILDDCEHVLGACAPMVGRLLATPGTSVLATSRQPLGLDSERIFTVPALGRADAVRLFTDRAEAVLPGFGQGDRRVIERICGALDDLPLAIELAAQRLRALSPEQVLERLDDRFRLLSGGSRAALPHHRSLSAMIEWSWRFCTPDERLVWARMSVFSGGVDPVAAEAVCAGDGLARDKILPALEVLADKSVLVRDGDRYRLPRTVAAYGRRHLHAAAPLARHGDHFRKIAAEARAQMFGPGQVAWLTRLRLEHDNLIAALERSSARTCLRMATDLLNHWIRNGLPAEGRRWLEHGLAAHAEPDELRANGLCAAARLAIIQADPAAATAMLDESAAIGRRLGLESVLANTALYRGMLAMDGGDADSAVAFLEDAVDRHGRIGDREGLALALTRLSLCGEAAPAITTGERGIAVCDSSGERWHRAHATVALAIGIWRRGDARRATGLVRESLRSSRSLDDRLGIGLSLEVLAWIAATERDYPRAAQLLGVLRGIWDAVGRTLPEYGNLAGHHGECVARTRRALGEAAFGEAMSRGAGLSAAEALAYALEEPPPSGDSPLTPRENEIAGLVAKGMSNKEIASELVIAQRTAEGHVERILSKLGFTSRTEIASWVARG